MRKRSRMLVVLLVLVAVGFMLWPTVQWYFLWDAEQREQASFTTQVIKDRAIKFASQGYILFEEKFKTSREDVMDLSPAKADIEINGISDSVREEAFNAIYDEVIRRAKVAKIKLPDEITYDYAKGAFIGGVAVGSTVESVNAIAEQNIQSFLEGYKRTEFFEVKDQSDRIIQLGLDLAGGVSYVLKADLDAYAEVQDLVSKEIAYADALRALTDVDSDTTLDFVSFNDYSKYDVNSNVDSIMEIAMEQITTRVNIYGASEPEIQRLGRDWIQVNLPGAKDPERLKRLLMGRGVLNFHVVDDEQTATLTDWISDNEYSEEWIRAFDSFTDGEEFKVPDGIGILPSNMVVGQYIKDEYREDKRTGWLVVHREPGMPGSQVQQATVYRADDTGGVGTSFRLTGQGQDQFAEMTNGATADAPITIAVLMDGKSKMAAAASEQLRESTLQVSGRGIDLIEAQDLAQLLNLGSKDVEISIISSDVIASGLGSDYIRTGAKALTWALLLVIIFMLVYYLGGGVVAVMALIMNIFIMAGILSQIQLTLTLAGLAGLILTIGMSVDANVIIYERIKEEMRLGKSPASALRSGFQKAFWTILDSNITTFIAAIVLSYFGSSTVKGFAMILAVGIFSSMFTALFVTRLFLDMSVETFKVKRLLISWRRK